jgi:hypothetical protein
MAGLSMAFRVFEDKNMNLVHIESRLVSKDEATKEVLMFAV